MLGSPMRWSCLLLLLLAVDCKPPRPYRNRGKQKATAHQRTLAAQPLVFPLAVASAVASEVTTPTPTPPSSAEAAARRGRSSFERREACEFKKGAMPEQTLSAEGPLGQRIPIDHFVIVMQ